MWAGLAADHALALLDHRALFDLLQQPVPTDAAAILARLAMEGVVVDRGGGSFDIAIDAGTEWVASASVGLRVRVGERFLFEPALRLDQHFADWDITDRASGTSASIDDYLLSGVHLAFAYRF